MEKHGIWSNIIRKIKFRMELRRMDHWWYFIGGNNWQLFPPSFYYTHTEEEIKRITGKKIDKLRAIRNKFIAEHNLLPQEKQQKKIKKNCDGLEYLLRNFHSNLWRSP